MRRAMTRKGLSTKGTTVRSNQQKQSLRAFILAGRGSKTWGIRVGAAKEVSIGQMSTQTESRVQCYEGQQGLRW